MTKTDPHSYREQILKALSRPMTAGDLAQQPGVSELGKRALRTTLKEMVAEGEIVKIRGGRYGLVSQMRLVTGRLTVHPDGYGFVAPEVAPEGLKLEGDLFIPPRRLNGALHGDRVVARAEGGDRLEGRVAGRVIRVLERGATHIVGTLERLGSRFVVYPEDRRYPLLNVEDPKPGGPYSAEDKGKMVIGRINHHPPAPAYPVGVIEEVLGEAGDPDVEARMVIAKFELPHVFPLEALKEAESLPENIRPADRRGRKDLRDRVIVTIDPETARDFDDAVCVEKEEGGYRLFVSIADVSHYVKPGSAIDAEAFLRGTSVYFPDRALPMLPEDLSSDLCSLKEGVDRLTLTAEMTFTSRGKLTGAELYPSVINSRRRLTYKQAAKYLEENDPEAAAIVGETGPMLKLAAKLAAQLTRARLSRGALDLDLPEAFIQLDEEGRTVAVRRYERTSAHRMVEEFMLAANEAAAARFAGGEIPFIYRVHEPPSAEDLEGVRAVAAAFGHQDLLRPPVTPKRLSALLKKVHGKDEEFIINRALLRSLKQARYSEENLGHFGLASNAYTHFTSPIRRYPDLLVHRLLKESWAKGKRVRRTPLEEVKRIADHSSFRERVAMEAERDMVDLKKAQLYAGRIGEVCEGIVSAVTGFGFFVQLADELVEGLVRVSTLTDDYYVYREREYALVGRRSGKRFIVGQKLLIQVESVDLSKRQINFLLAREPREARPGAPKKPSGGGRKRR